MILKYSVGLDVSSEKINGCISTIDASQTVKVKATTSFSNTLKGFKDFENWCEKHHKDKDIPLVVCMEATGIYHENCALYLFEKKYSLSIILPNKAKKYMQALGLKSKNDNIDAKGLAQMGAEQNLKKWEPMAEFFYTLRSLTRQYQNLQEQKTVLRNQMHAFERGMFVQKKIIKQLNKLIELIEKQLKELLEAIDNQIKSDPKVEKKVNNICAIKGLAILTVATILAETNGFELFENYKQLVSYAGFDVIENESGKYTGRTRISKKGNSRIRRALFMPAFCVIKCEQKPFLNLYNRTYEKHGIKMKSYVAVQKKMLLMIYYLWKSGKEYDPNYTQKNSHDNTSVAIQDNNPKGNFSEMQNYKNQLENANQTKKEIHSNSENRKQPRQNSQVSKIQIQ